MYGKHFTSMYTGSMYGAGANVFAVWGYAISHVEDGIVELNPKYLASVLGMAESDVGASIDYLCAPDPISRSKGNDGARMVRIGEFAYEVTNHKQYREMRSASDRRAYMRDYMRNNRPPRGSKVNKVNSGLTEVNKVNNVNFTSLTSASVSVSDSVFNYSLEECVSKIRQLPWRDADSVAVEQEFTEQVAKGNNPQEIVEKLEQINVWTQDGAMAPRLYEVLRRWKEPRHLWERKEENRGKSSNWEAIREGLSETS